MPWTGSARSYRWRLQRPFGVECGGRTASRSSIPDTTPRPGHCGRDYRMPEQKQGHTPAANCRGWVQNHRLRLGIGEYGCSQVRPDLGDGDSGRWHLRRHVHRQRTATPSRRWTSPISGGGGGGAPTDATYVTLSTNGSLSNERVLTGTGKSRLPTPGQGSTVTAALTATGVLSAGTYTLATITVDSKADHVCRERIGGDGNYDDKRDGRRLVSLAQAHHARLRFQRRPQAHAAPCHPLKTKLDGIGAGANVSTVFGRSGRLLLPQAITRFSRSRMSRFRPPRRLARLHPARSGSASHDLACLSGRIVEGAAPTSTTPVRGNLRYLSVALMRARGKLSRKSCQPLP